MAAFTSKGSRCSKFNVDWLKEKDKNCDLISAWCIPGSDAQFGFCTFCNISINCSHHGIAALKRHSENKKHINLCSRNRDKDGHLKKNSQTRLDLTCVGQKSLSHSENVASAEAVFACAVAMSNIPYSFANTATKMFNRMFPDSTIAKEFNCKKSKLSYLISDGLGPHLKEKLIEEIIQSNAFYCIQVDECTISEKRVKQLDLLVRFFSENQQKVVVHHLKSYHLGQATAEILFDTILDGVTNLPSSKFLCFQSDGPNVMLCVKGKLKEHFPNILDVGSCTLHCMHNAFSKGLSAFGSEVENFALDLYYFFKRSALQSEKFKSLQIKLSVPEHLFLRHVSNRWLTLIASIDRIIEQYDALKEYFLSQAERKVSDKYKLLASTLKAEDFLCKMLFIKNAAVIFTDFLELMQKEEPLIHILYDEIVSVLKRVMGRFLESDAYKDKDGISLKSLDVERSKYWKKRPEIGVDTEKVVRNLSESGRKTFFLGCRSFYIVVAKYLQSKLPLDILILKHLQCLQPEMRSKKASLSSIKYLASLLPSVFNSSDVNSIVDDWIRLQAADENELPALSGNLVCASLSDEESDREESPCNVPSIDKYWAEICQIKDSSGNLKYGHLSVLIKALLSIAHGSADVERGFSINNKMLDGRANFNINSIDALRQVKSFMKMKDNDLNNLTVDRKMLKALGSARQNYRDRLLKEKTINAEKRKCEEEDDGDDLSKLKLEEKNLNVRLNSYQDMLNRAQSEINSGLKLKDLNKIQCGQVLLTESNEKIQELHKKISDVKKRQISILMGKSKKQKQ